MKKRLQGVIVGILITLLFTNVVSATAIKSTIEVVFNKMNIEINGKKVEADNILYNGTTYVPLRFVSEEFGYNVDFSETTNTVNIQEDSNESVTCIGNGIIPNNVFSNNNSVNYFSMRYKTKIDLLEDVTGQKYDTYFLLSDKAKEKVYIMLNTDGKYSSFESKLGLTKKSKDTKQVITFKIYADDKVVYTHTLKAGDKPQNIAVNISKAKELKFEIDASVDGEYYEIALFNNMFK